MYDVIIIGAGPAGLAAATYCARGRLATLVLGKSIESRSGKAPIIENYFGFPNGISGKELLSLGIEHAKRFGARIIDEEVVAIRPSDHFQVESATTERFTSKAVILATGISAKSSGIQNEDQFIGRGIAYCGTCDGFFYRNKRLAVIGWGNYAAKEALELLPYTNDISILSQGHAFEISDLLLEELGQTSIRLRQDKVMEFLGEEQLGQLKLESGELLPVDGAFLALGMASTADFARTLGLEMDKGCVVVNKDRMSNFPGIFAAGDCAGPPFQIAKCVGDGCVAALSVMTWIRHK